MRKYAACVAACLFLSTGANAEPYIAVEEGLQCSACHTHAAGAGMRTAYGNIYAQKDMASRVAKDDADLWSGQVTQWLAVGSNLRGQFAYSESDDAADRSAFDITRGNVYLEARLLGDKVSLYLDQQVAPSSSINREAYVLLRGKKFRFTAGQFYLPYGLRLQDDSAFVRRATGINLSNPDRGVQVSFETGGWSHAMSITNGSGGGSETDNGKQASLMSSYVTSRWRIGASANHNDSDAGDRTMANIFGGLRTGPIAWLLEIDAIRDELPDDSEQDGVAGIVEANWRLRRGHNLKISYEYFDPNTDISEDHQTRWSTVYEFTPLAFLQARFGARSNDGPAEVSGATTDIVFAELHGFF